MFWGFYTPYQYQYGHWVNIQLAISKGHFLNLDPGSGQVCNCILKILILNIKYIEKPKNSSKKIFKQQLLKNGTADTTKTTTRVLLPTMPPSIKNTCHRALTYTTGREQINSKLQKLEESFRQMSYKNYFLMHKMFFRIKNLRNKGIIE